MDNYLLQPRPNYPKQLFMYLIFAAYMHPPTCFSMQILDCGGENKIHVAISYFTLRGSVLDYSTVQPHGSRCCSLLCYRLSHKHSPL